MDGNSNKLNPIFHDLFMYNYFKFDNVFSIETVMERAGIARSVRCLWTLSSSAKIRNKKDWRGSLVATPMPKSVLSGGREDQRLRE